MGQIHPITENVPLLPRDEVILHPVCPRGYLAVNVVISSVLLLAVALLWLADVDGGSVILLGRPLPETCVHKRVFGRPCAGCGLTRSLVLAADGRWVAARAQHPGGLWLIGYLLFQIAGRLTLVGLRPGHVRVRQADLVLSIALLALALYVPLFARIG